MFLGSDVGLFVNLPAVQARYGGLLAGTRFALPRLLRSGAFGLPKFDARQAAQIAAVADGVIQDGGGRLRASRRAECVGPAGVTVGRRSRRPAGHGCRRQVLAGERPHPLPLCSTPSPAASRPTRPGGSGVELAKRVRTAFPEAAPADDPHGTYMPPTAGRRPGSSPGQFWRCAGRASPWAWLQAARTLYRARAAVAQNLPLVGPPTWVRGEVTHRGRVFDHLRLRFDLDAATAAIADDGVRQAAHTTMKSLAGEGSDQWLGTDGGHGLRVTAADWPAARTLVDAFLADGAKAADDTLVQAIRTRLPAEASAVVVLDAARFACQVGGLARGAVDALPAFPGLELPEFVLPAGRSPFLGLAVVTRPTGGRVALVLPAEAIKASLATVRVAP